MSIATFRVKHRRPTKLSDPHYDFTPTLLQSLLDTPDYQMGRVEYTQLFGPYLPAGTYKESVYFLPMAFRYLLAHEAEAFELVTPIFGFVGSNNGYLEKDGILEIVRDCMRECLAFWIRDFQVRHYDKKACRERGWRYSYSDYVENSDLVVQATQDLVRFNGGADLAVEFVRDLAFSEDNLAKTAWFLEYSRRQFRGIYRPPLYEPITQLINDDDLILKAAITVEEKVAPNEHSPTYWRNTFKTLGLA